MFEIKTLHKIIIGDSRKMKEVSVKSIHLIITSPPYWQLKDYGNGKQIGFNDSYEEYINNLFNPDLQIKKNRLNLNFRYPE